MVDLPIINTNVRRLKHLIIIFTLQTIKMGSMDTVDPSTRMNKA